MKVAIILTSGFEEVEAVTPIDFLRRAGLQVFLLSAEKKWVVGAHQIILECNDLLENSLDVLYDAVILPGGMPASQNLADNHLVISLIEKHVHNKKLIAAICAAPALVLPKIVSLQNYQFTCHPSMHNNINNKNLIKDKKTVIDRQLITSQGPGTAGDFTYHVLKYLTTKELADTIMQDSLYEIIME